MSILRRLWPHRKPQAGITMGVHVVTVLKPIALAERQPGAVECSSGVWIGFWEDVAGIWDWEFKSEPEAWDTHWLPASVEVLPTRCCVPEVE